MSTLNEGKLTPTGSEAPRAVLAAHIGKGELPYQRCAECGSAQFPPRVLCRSCGRRSLHWLISDGLGVVYSSSAVPQRNAESRSVALVDLDEGFRMMSSVLGCPADEVTIGSRVYWVAPAAENESFGTFQCGDRP